MPRASRRRFRLVPAVAALTAALATAPAARAADNPYERGPAPTEASVTAVNGPFAVTTLQVAKSSVTGFGGGIIYYPTDGGQTYGGIALVPGFTGTWSTISWLGPRLASQGFVVFGIETTSIFDGPDSRAAELLAALDYLTKTSSVRGRVDASRLAVGGHSMGGGGSLRAAKDRTSLKAVVPMAPWNNDKTWPEIVSPTLVIGGQSDIIAPDSSGASPIYESLTGTPEKEYLELTGADHWYYQTPSDTVAKYMISWYKRFVDDDTRYTQFLCPAPGTGSTFSDVRSSCPM